MNNTLGQISIGEISAYQIKELSDYCFSKCSNLTSIKIPSSITKLPFECFNECRFKEFIIPSQIKDLGNSCFSKQGQIFFD